MARRKVQQRFVVRVMVLEMAPQWLPKAPIVEALVDFKFASDLESTESLSRFADGVAQAFPERKPIMLFEGQFDLTAEQPIISAPPPYQTGVQLWSEDKRRVIQARQNGMTFSMLRPYTDWSDFEAGVHDAWLRFVEAVGARTVARISLRYVNQIDLPLSDAFRFEDYLRFFPRLPEDLPPAVAGMFMRLQLPGEHGAKVFLTEAFGADVAPPDGNVLPLVLDIEALLDGQFHSPDELWPNLQNLRALKNRVFFNALTKRALEMYK